MLQEQKSRSKMETEEDGRKGTVNGLDYPLRPKASLA